MANSSNQTELEKKIFYTKQELLDELYSSELLLDPLLNIVCNYCYYLRYRKYAIYSVFENHIPVRYHFSVRFGNLLIECINGACSIENISNKEILYKRKNVWYTSIPYGGPCVRDNEIFFVTDPLRNEKKVPNFKVKSTIYFSENDGEYKVNEGKLFETIEYLPDIQEDKQIEKIIDGDQIKNMIEIDQVKKMLSDFLRASVSLDSNSFNVDSEGVLSGICHSNEKKEMYFFEYDRNAEQMLDHYVLENYSEIFLSGYGISFDNEYMTIYDNDKKNLVQFKKDLIQ